MGRAIAMRNTLTWGSESGAYGPVSLSIDPVKILRIHGYEDVSAVRPIIQRTAEKIAVRAAKIMTPVAIFRRIGVVHANSEVLTLENGLSFEGHAFSNYFADAKDVIVVIITVGKLLDDEVIGCMDVFEPLEALFLGTAGWLEIEPTTRSFKNILMSMCLLKSSSPRGVWGPGIVIKLMVKPKCGPWRISEIFSVFLIMPNFLCAF